MNNLPRMEDCRLGTHAGNSLPTRGVPFVGYTKRGIDDRAKRILSFGNFERHFGGLVYDSELSYAVQHFFQNGGSESHIVRIPRLGQPKRR